MAGFLFFLSFVAFLCSFLSLFMHEKLAFWDRKTSKRKAVIYYFLAYGVFTVAATSINIKNNKSEQIKEVEQPKQSKTTLDISTSRAIDGVPIKLEKGKDVDGLENWFGRHETVIVQLLGKESDVTKANITLIQDGSSANAQQGATYLKKFLTNIMGEANANQSIDLAREVLDLKVYKSKEIGSYDVSVSYIKFENVFALEVVIKPI